MRQEILYLILGGILELLGVLTLISNPDSMIGTDIGFQIPALVSPDIQGIGLLLVGGALTTSGILIMKRRQ